MGWSFHKRRNRRYQIALEELKKTYQAVGGAQILSECQGSSLSAKEKKLIKLADKLASCFEPYSRDYKKKHSKFLNYLREIVKKLDDLDNSKSWHSSFRRMILELCKTKFYRVHLFMFGHHLLQDLFASLTSKTKPTPLNFDHHFANYSFLDESRFILASQPLIFLERDLRKVNETFTQTVFDPHKYNHPFLLYTFVMHAENGGVRRIKMVRMGSPTYETIHKKPRVIEEFVGFLKSLEVEKKCHLYVNKQRTWGKEGRRSYVVKELEDRYPHFFCVCLPSDGAFYYQQMSYASQSEAELFKETFYQLLIGQMGPGYFHFPKKWLKEESFCRGLREVLQSVHELYFNSKKELSIRERRHFIDHAYTQIIIYCLKKYPIHSVNITCRDGIDRAGCEQAKLLYYFQLTLGIENHVESKIERQYLMHIPPYLAKSRPIVKERREYLYELMNESYKPEVVEKIREVAVSQPLLYVKPLFIKRT